MLDTPGHNYKQAFTSEKLVSWLACHEVVPSVQNKDEAMWLMAYRSTAATYLNCIM